MSPTPKVGRVRACTTLPAIHMVAARYRPSAPSEAPLDPRLFRRQERSISFLRPLHSIDLILITHAVSTGVNLSIRRESLVRSAEQITITVKRASRSPLCPGHAPRTRPPERVGNDTLASPSPTGVRRSIRKRCVIPVTARSTLGGWSLVVRGGCPIASVRPHRCRGIKAGPLQPEVSIGLPPPAVPHIFSSNSHSNKNVANPLHLFPPRRSPGSVHAPDIFCSLG